ncbi:MAG TPA: DUF6529 family protein [Thermoleophilaceae bacterium]|nr:DUF6529 family protein [Thermoleophilaceae bacterium]
MTDTLEQLIEDVTRGNVTEVKVVLATVVMALAVYQLLLAAVGYGWLRVPFLASAPALWTHRASGDTIAILVVVVALMCVGYYGFELGDDGGTHAVVAIGLLGVLAAKVLVVRVGGRLGRLLPLLGVSLLVLLGITWWTSAAGFLGIA